MPTKRVIAAALIPLGLLAGCGGTSTSDWSTGADVVAGLKSADIPCLAAAADPEVDSSAKGRGIEYIQCDKFGVMLIVDRDLYGTVENCQGTELLDWNKADEQKVIVGPNFVITPIVTGTESIPTFPPDATAEKLIDAFGGDEVSVTDWMTSQGCVRPAATTAPAPASS